MKAERVAKLLVVAQQDESPQERDRAREILSRMGEWPLKPPPPPLRVELTREQRAKIAYYRVLAGLDE